MLTESINSTFSVQGFCALLNRLVLNRTGRDSSGLIWIVELYTRMLFHPSELKHLWFWVSVLLTYLRESSIAILNSALWIQIQPQATAHSNYHCFIAN